MCSFHVVKAVKPKLDPLPAESRDGLKRDMATLQCAKSPELFHTLCELFFEKWSQDPTADVCAFISLQGMYVYYQCDYLPIAFCTFSELPGLPEAAVDWEERELVRGIGTRLPIH